MADNYFTLATASKSIYKEKMSKFLAFAHPVESAKEAKEIVARYRKEYYDARHVCWAYMIGAAREEFLSSDDGEPSGTAGKPILGQLNSFKLTNIVVVVVRYFGGIKLGTSGLIVAYREAAREAITAGEIVERHEMSTISFTFPYLSMNEVMRAVKDPQVNILSQEFDNSCQMRVEIPRDYAEMVCRRLIDIDGVTLNT